MGSTGASESNNSRDIVQIRNRRWKGSKKLSISLKIEQIIDVSCWAKIEEKARVVVRKLANKIFQDPLLITWCAQVHSVKINPEFM